jgi:hypothetical protein
MLTIGGVRRWCYQTEFEEALNQGILCIRLELVRLKRGLTLRLFDGDEAPESAESSFGKFGLRWLIRDFCGEP